MNPAQNPRVTAVDAVTIRRDLPEPWGFAIEPYPQATCVIVRVSTESGVAGFGEAIARKAPDATAAIVRDYISPIVIGRRLSEIGAVWRDAVRPMRRWGHTAGFLHEALSGVDIALWDARARALDVRLVDLLPNGAIREEIPTYASSVYFTESVEEAQDLAEELVNAGFSAIKIKVGYPQKVGGTRRDVATVEAIREVVGDDVRLMVDANGAYGLGEALRVVDHFADLDVSWLEEPFAPDDLESYRALARSSTVPLAGGETLASATQFRSYLATGAFSYIQPDVARCGGITGFLHAASLCYAYDTPICPHTGFSGGINNLAGLHLAGSLLNDDDSLLEYMIIDNPLRRIFDSPLPEAEDGVLRVPDGAGLGRVVSSELLR